MVDYAAAAADLIKRFDQDGDGELGLDEFKNLYEAFKEKKPEILQYTPEELFVHVDKDKTGTINLAELTQHLEDQKFDPNS